MGRNDIYGVCSSLLAANATTDETLQCFSAQLAEREYPRQILLFFAATMVFLMQAGFAMVVGGAVQRKNVQNSMLKNLLDACGASLAFFAVGYAFSFGGMDTASAEKTFIGATNFFLMDVENYGFWMFQYTFSAASATIVAGTLAERCQMGAYMGYSLFLVGWVYPVVAHAIWSNTGFLSASAKDPLFDVGVIDFAGSVVVHLTGGFTALLATIVLGPRQGRFFDEDGEPLAEAKEFHGHSVALQVLGTFLLWFGWFGFNGGSALVYETDYLGYIVGLVGVNTSLAGGTAGTFALFSNYWYIERKTGEPILSLKHAMNGSLAGLVAITGSCGVVEGWASVLIGSIAGVLYTISSRILEKLRIDDAVDAIPVHFVNGMWGALSTGLLAAPRLLERVYGHNKHPGWFYSVADGESDGTLFGVQCIGVLLVLLWVLLFMYPFFAFLSWRGWLRADPLEEIVGLDVSLHGGKYLLSHDGPEDKPPSPQQMLAFEQMKEERRCRSSKLAYEGAQTIEQESVKSTTEA